MVRLITHQNLLVDEIASKLAADQSLNPAQSPRPKPAIE